MFNVVSCAVEFFIFVLQDVKRRRKRNYALPEGYTDPWDPLGVSNNLDRLMCAEIIIGSNALKNNYQRLKIHTTIITQAIMVH